MEVNGKVVCVKGKVEEQKEDYWGAIAENRFATLVKVCDIYDNLDPRRMCYLDEDKQKRLRAKYGRALQVLAGA